MIRLIRRKLHFYRVENTRWVQKQVNNVILLFRELNESIVFKLALLFLIWMLIQWAFSLIILIGFKWTVFQFTKSVFSLMSLKIISLYWACLYPGPRRKPEYSGSLFKSALFKCVVKRQPRGRVGNGEGRAGTARSLAGWRRWRFWTFIT